MKINILCKKTVEFYEYFERGKTIFVLGVDFCKGERNKSDTNPQSRYTEKYLIYDPDLGRTYTKLPDKNLYVENDISVITGLPQYPKFAMDSPEGWLACLSTNDLLFIKKNSSLNR